jgi:hypothetical protein
MVRAGSPELRPEAAVPVAAVPAAAVPMAAVPMAAVPQTTRPWARPVVLMPAFAAISAVAGLLPSFSLAANLLVLAVGGALCWLGFTGRVAKRPVPRRLSTRTAWWLLPALLLCAIELVNFGLGSTYAHPTLSELADPLLEGYLARSALYFGWLVAFWGLVRR